MPIFLFAFAGAMLFGGAAMLDTAQKESARDEALRRQEFEARILQGLIDQDELRTEARRRGLDPDVVLAGYQGLATNNIDLDTVINTLRLA